VRMNTIFYGFICLALAFKVQARLRPNPKVQQKQYTCRFKEETGVFLEVVDSSKSYFANPQIFYADVPDTFYEENPTVKVLYSYSERGATKFMFNKKDETYTSNGLKAPLVFTSKMWDSMCKPPEDQYNCESLLLSGKFLKIDHDIDHLRAGGIYGILWGEKTSTTAQFYLNNSDGSFWFEKPGHPVVIFNSKMIDAMCKMVEVDLQYEVLLLG